MRHLKRGRKLNRTPSHKRAMLRNLVSGLFLSGRITTTPAKAKEARPFAEKLITLARDGSLHARRRALSLLQNKEVVRSLFAEIGPRYQNRPGGYTRILHLAKTRVGDGAAQAIFELVEGEVKSHGGAVRATVDDGTALAESSGIEVKAVEAEVVSSEPADASEAEAQTAEAATESTEAETVAADSSGEAEASEAKPSSDSDAEAEAKEETPADDDKPAGK